MKKGIVILKWFKINANQNKVVGVLVCDGQMILYASDL